MRAVSLSLAVALCVMAQCVVASAGASCNNQAGRVPPEVYQAEVIVTGLEEAERLRGFREALEEIVLKATAQPAPVSAGILREIAENPKYYVAQFCYEDRNRHLKTNDEQGTRDRPHFLRVTADLARLQAALVKASLSIWSERPNIQVMLTVNTANARFLLADESEAPRPAPVAIDLDGQKVPVASAKYEGYEQRETLKLIGKRRGLPIQLPQSSAMAAKSGGQPLEIGKLFPADGFGTGTVRYRVSGVLNPPSIYRFLQ